MVDKPKWIGWTLYGCGIVWMGSSMVLQGLGAYNAPMIVYLLSNFIGLNLIAAGAYLFTPLSRIEVFEKFDKKSEVFCEADNS